MRADEFDLEERKKKLYIWITTRVAKYFFKIAILSCLKKGFSVDLKKNTHTQKKNFLVVIIICPS